MINDETGLTQRLENSRRSFATPEPMTKLLDEYRRSNRDPLLFAPQQRSKNSDRPDIADAKRRMRALEKAADEHSARMDRIYADPHARYMFEHHGVLLDDNE
jgi:hypothetical protein